VFSTLNSFVWRFVWRAGHFTALFDGFRPGQMARKRWHTLGARLRVMIDLRRNWSAALRLYAINLYNSHHI
jgi:hypothetical protein